MQFTTSSLVAFSVLFSVINAATVVVPAQPKQTKAIQIKHVNYRCAANANANRCASAKATLRLKENNGCDVVGKLLPPIAALYGN